MRTTQEVIHSISEVIGATPETHPNGRITNLYAGNAYVRVEQATPVVETWNVSGLGQEARTHVLFTRREDPENMQNLPDNSVYGVEVGTERGVIVDFRPGLARIHRLPALAV